MKKSVRIVMLGLLALGASEVACGFMMAATPTPAATTAASTAAAGGPTMSISRKQFFGAAAALTAGVAVVRPVGPALADPIPTVGNEAPDFKLPSNTGTDLSLSDLIAGGSTLVLYFYPGDFTQGCTIEANAFQKDVAAGKYKELNARVVGVSVDSIEKHLDFKNKYSLDFPLLSDRDAVVADKYGAKLQIPVLGKFANRYTYIINGSGKIEKVFTDVESKVAKHSDDVLAYLSSRK